MRVFRKTPVARIIANDRSKCKERLKNRVDTSLSFMMALKIDQSV
jgi:hypothetical protein